MIFRSFRKLNPEKRQWSNKYRYCSKMDATETECVENYKLLTESIAKIAEEQKLSYKVNTQNTKANFDFAATVGSYFKDKASTSVEGCV